MPVSLARPAGRWPAVRCKRGMQGGMGCMPGQAMMGGMPQGMQQQQMMGAMGGMPQ